MFRNLILLFLLGISVQVFSQADNYTFEIRSSDAFAKFAGAPLTHAFAGVSSIKMIYHLESGKLYFINSKKFPLHYNFYKEEFGDIELPEFNQLNYQDNPNRQCYLATLNYFKDANIYTLEFSPADDISQDAVEMVFNHVRKAFFPSDIFLQLSTQKLLGYTNWNIPVTSVDDLFTSQKLQIIQKGSVRGKLLMVDADSLKYLTEVRNCIIFIRGNSNEIPLCRGIITTSFQTPLSHISILAQNRKTPVVALKEADSDKKILALADKKVNFTVLQDTFLLELDSSISHADDFKAKVIKLPLDSSTRLIAPLSKIRLKEVPAYGVKAVNLALLQTVKYKGKHIRTPEGAFAIPMFYYLQHVKSSGADTMINELLANYKNLPESEVHQHLNKIVTVIASSRINKAFLKEVENMIKSSGTSSRYRFRSSSNAEDLDGFNGAGLYTSETGETSRSIEKAIKKVWASLWSERAFDERCNAGIAHEFAGMAILAHRSFPNELANGVAITRNLYRDFDFGFVVNLQVGDNSLVKPQVGLTCEQFISYFNSTDPFFNEKDAVEYLSFSSLSNNQPILTKKEVFELTQQLDRIKRKFYHKLKIWKKLPYKDFAMDVEFKAELVNGKKVFYFKQARPFGKSI